MEAFVKTAVDGVVAPMDVPSIVPPEIETFDEIKFVISPFVLKRFVVVAFVPVAFVKVTP